MLLLGCIIVVFRVLSVDKRLKIENWRVCIGIHEIIIRKLKYIMKLNRDCFIYNELKIIVRFLII